MRSSWIWDRRRDIPAFTDQLFEYCDHRTLAQSVGIFLELEADDVDALCAQIEHRVDGAVEMLGIAQHRGLEQRQVEIQAVSAIDQSAEILGRQDPPKEKPGLR